MNGSMMAAEIKEQPAVLDRILSEGRAGVLDVARAVRARRPRFVLFVARGTSDHAALYAKYLVETRLALPAGLASPSTMTVYDARPDLRDVLVLAVSQSGASPTSSSRSPAPAPAARSRSPLPTPPIRRSPPRRSSTSTSWPARNARSRPPRPTRLSC